MLRVPAEDEQGRPLQGTASMSVSSLLQACKHLLLEMRLLGGWGGGQFQKGDEKHPPIPSAEAGVPGDPLSGPLPPERL